MCDVRHFIIMDFNFMGLVESLCRVRNKIMYARSKRNVYTLSRVLFVVFISLSTA